MSKNVFIFLTLIVWVAQNFSLNFAGVSPLFFHFIVAIEKSNATFFSYFFHVMIFLLNFSEKF